MTVFVRAGAARPDDPESLATPASPGDAKKAECRTEAAAFAAPMFFWRAGQKKTSEPAENSRRISWNKCIDVEARAAQFVFIPITKTIVATPFRFPKRSARDTLRQAFVVTLSPRIRLPFLAR